MAAANGTSASEHDIKVNKLSYKFQDGSYGLTDIILDLPAGSRTLLVGGEFPPTNHAMKPPKFCTKVRKRRTHQD